MNNKMLMRELTAEEIEATSGGVRFAIGAVVGGLFYDGVKQAAKWAVEWGADGGSEGAYQTAKIG